jgi:hypothetical protein
MIPKTYCVYICRTEESRTAVLSYLATLGYASRSERFPLGEYGIYIDVPEALTYGTIERLGVALGSV